MHKLLERTQELLDKLDKYDIDYISIPIGPKPSLLTHEIRVYKNGYGFSTTKRSWQVYFDNNAEDLLVYMVENLIEDAVFRDTVYSINVRFKMDKHEEGFVKVVFVGVDYSSEVYVDFETAVKVIRNIIVAPQVLDLWYAIGDAALYITEKSPGDLVSEILRVIHTTTLYPYLIDLVSDNNIDKNYTFEKGSVFSKIILDRDFQTEVLLLKDKQYIFMAKRNQSSIIKHKALCIIVRNEFDKDNILSIYDRARAIYDSIDSDDLLNKRVVIDVVDENDLNMKFINLKL